jgi:hypothetical protein
MKRFLIVALLLAAVTANAQPPRTMNFQGTLADGAGNPMADGPYSLAFRIWNSDIGGTQLWTETVPITLERGVFSTILGQTTPLNLPFNQQYWLGVAVGADPELSPRTALTSMPYAMNVADGAIVKSLNGLKDGVNLLPGPNVSIVTAGPNITISATGAVTDNDWDVSGANMTSIPVGNVGIGEPVPTAKLHVAGDITAGNATTRGMLRAANGNGFFSEFGGDVGGDGGKMYLREETGTWYMGSEPDFNGTGGFFWVNNGNGGNALRVDGHDGSTGNAVVGMYGTSSSVFALGQTGNASVQLPAGSIGATEIEDEPGMATINALGAGSFLLTTSYTAATSRTITAPTSGYLLVMASYEIDLRHETPGASFVTAGVSLSATSLPSNQDHSFYMPSVAPAGIYLTPSSSSAVFNVAAGSHTVYLVGNISGSSVSYLWDAQLTALFIPTAYGTITPTSGTQTLAQKDIDTVVPALTSTDIADEQRTSIRTNEERMARELEALRAEVQAIKQAMNNENANPDRMDR